MQIAQGDLRALCRLTILLIVFYTFIPVYADQHSEYISVLVRVFCEESKKITFIHGAEVTIVPEAGTAFDIFPLRRVTGNGGVAIFRLLPVSIPAEKYRIYVYWKKCGLLEKRNVVLESGSRLQTLNFNFKGCGF